MPGLDDDGRPLLTAISTRSGVREGPYGLLEFLGGNAYMLRVIAANAAWSGTYVAPSELEESASRTARNVTTAARVEVLDARRDGATLRVRVRVTNETGHRFPTAYPTRRAWLHVRALDATGAVLFESGAVDATGAIVGDGGRRPDAMGTVFPHRSTITRADEVQVWEGVPVDARGEVTHALLRAVGWAKDDRILPRGWVPTHPDARWTAPVGTAGDADFAPGSDEAACAVATSGRVAARVEVTLLFQTVTPAAVEDFAPADTPATRRFVAMTRALPPAPTVVAAVRAELTP